MCNINFFSNRYLPVLFHNLKGYDGHLIIRGAFKINQEIGDEEISAIPKSNDKFMSFKIGDSLISTVLYVNCLINLSRTYTTRKINFRTSITWKKTLWGTYGPLMSKGLLSLRMGRRNWKVGLWGHPSYRVFPLTSYKWERPIWWWWYKMAMRRRRIRTPSSNKIRSIVLKFMMLLIVRMSGTTTWHIFIAMCCFLQMSVATSGRPALNTMIWTPQIIRQVHP